MWIRKLNDDFELLIVKLHYGRSIFTLCLILQEVKLSIFLTMNFHMNQLQFFSSVEAAEVSSSGSVKQNSNIWNVFALKKVMMSNLNYHSKLPCWNKNVNFNFLIFLLKNLISLNEEYISFFFLLVTITFSCLVLRKCFLNIFILLKKTFVHFREHCHHSYIFLIVA